MADSGDTITIKQWKSQSGLLHIFQISEKFLLRENIYNARVLAIARQQFPERTRETLNTEERAGLSAICIFETAAADVQLIVPCRLIDWRT